MDSQDGKVGRGVAPDDFGRECPPIRESDFDFVRFIDDVIIGNDNAAGINDEA